jgi:hypothetical protein
MSGLREAWLANAWARAASGSTCRGHPRAGVARDGLLLLLIAVAFIDAISRRLRAAIMQAA